MAPGIKDVIQGDQDYFFILGLVVKGGQLGRGLLRGAQRTDSILSRPKAGLMVVSYSGRLTNSDLMKG